MTTISTISTTMNNALISFSRVIIEDTINAIATKHGHDIDEMMREFMPTEFILQATTQAKEVKAIKEKAVEPVIKEKKEKVVAPVKTEQPAFVLPWCAQVNDRWCSALRANYGLYTQCTMPPKSGEKYCKTCAKHAESAPDNIPPCGTVQQRMDSPILDYRDPKGKKASLYSAYMKKMNLNEAQVTIEAAKFGFTVPAEQFSTISTGRGRPKKSTIVDDSASESSSDSVQKKKPGRPKKSTTQEIDPEDLIASAMTKPHNSPDTSPDTIPDASPNTKLHINVNIDSETTFPHIHNNSSTTPHFQKIILTPDSSDDETDL